MRVKLYIYVIRGEFTNFLSVWFGSSLVNHTDSCDVVGSLKLVNENIAIEHGSCVV
jgi:hypothetical protein